MSAKTRPPPSRRRAGAPAEEGLASLTFLGAARQVTGSCHLLRTAEASVLLECGLFQGPPRLEALNRRRFPFRPAELDAVVLSHAHLDHSGLLPRLVREGFRGAIHLTPATLSLLEVMLKDAAHLAARDAEWENRRRQRAGREPIEPLYGLQDVEATLGRCEPLPYGQPREVAPGVELRLEDAGHILGSALVTLQLSSRGPRRTVVFTGDLGNSNDALLRDPQRLATADLLLLESTYGDRDHRPLAETLAELEDILAAADRAGGNVVMPAFAIGRTQEILFRLGELHHAGKLRQRHVFLDSPMAIAANHAYLRHRDLFNPQAREAFETRAGCDWQRWLPVLRYTETPEQSAALNLVHSGAVIIAGSGMCTGGRILHHLKHTLWRRETQVVISGFQAEGTPGRALVDGARYLRLLGQEIAVRAQVHTTGGFSAHAGRSQLLHWARALRSAPRVCLVHGESGAMASLAGALTETFGWRVEMPAQGERVVID